jgi:hypothetical protein
MGPALRAGERKLHLGSNPSHAIGEHGNNPGQTVSTALTDLVSIPAGLRGARYGRTVWENGMGERYGSWYGRTVWELVWELVWENGMGAR